MTIHVVARQHQWLHQFHCCRPMVITTKTSKTNATNNITNQYYHHSPFYFNALSTLSSCSSVATKTSPTTTTTNQVRYHHEQHQNNKIQNRSFRILMNRDISTSIHSHSMTSKPSANSHRERKYVHNTSHPSATASFHFATTDYADMMNPRNNLNDNSNSDNDDTLRQQALYYLNQRFDPTLWFKDPVGSM